LFTWLFNTYILWYCARGENNNLNKDNLFFVSQFILLKIMFVGQKQILTVWFNGVDSRSADEKVVRGVEVEGPACKQKKKLNFAKI